MCLMGQKYVGFGKEYNVKHYYAALITQNNLCLQKNKEIKTVLQKCFPI